MVKMNFYNTGSYLCDKGRGDNYARNGVLIKGKHQHFPFVNPFPLIYVLSNLTAIPLPLFSSWGLKVTECIEVECLKTTVQRAHKAAGEMLKFRSRPFSDIQPYCADVIEALEALLKRVGTFCYT